MRLNSNAIFNETKIVLGVFYWANLTRFSKIDSINN